MAQYGGWTISNPYGAKGQSGGGMYQARRGTIDKSRGGGGGATTNDWWEQRNRAMAQGIRNRYQQQGDQLVNKAMGLGDKDYTAELRKMALEDVGEQQRKAQIGLQSLGMAELGQRRDVLDDWTKRREGASTRAAIEGANMQRQAYETASGMVRSASATELDSIMAKLQSLSQGGGHWAQVQQMLIPLMEKYGYYQRGGAR